MDRGLVQIYTGNGKGKTTAALGLGLRAIGRGYKVKMFQFLKGQDSGELEVLPKLGEMFEIIRLGETKKFFFLMSDDEKRELKEKLQQEFEQVMQVLSDDSCDVLILDEIMATITNELISLHDVLDLIAAKPAHMEVILTGRNAPEELQKRADLVTNMDCIKHYMDEGVPARKGIEY